MCCQGRLQHDGNACVKSDTAAPGCWTEWMRQRSERERGEREKRVKINRLSHRLTFGLVYLTMISILSCSVRPVSLADINMLYCAVSLALSL